MVISSRVWSEVIESVGLPFSCHAAARRLANRVTLGLWVAVIAAPISANGAEVTGTTGAIDTVAPELAAQVAVYYAAERWPGARMVSVTPYFSFVGEVNAYAVMFAKPGSELLDEADAAARMDRAGLRLDAAETALAAEGQRLGLARKEQRRPAADTVAPAPANLTRDSRGATVGVPLDHAIELPAALRGDDPRQAQAVRDEKRLAALNAKVREARDAAALAGEAATVIVASRRDLFPLLERFDGAPAHLKDRAAVARVAGADADPFAPIARTVYLAPMVCLHEANPADVAKAMPRSIGPEPVYVDPERLLRVTPGLLGAGMPANGRLAPAQPDRCGAPPTAFWESFEKTGAPPANLLSGASHTIHGVPYYHGNDYADGASGPGASAMVLGYWSDHGYGSLVSNGSSVDGHVSELVYNLLYAEGYDPPAYNYGSDIEVGIEAVCNQSSFASGYAFDATTDLSVGWTTDLVTQINADQPVIFQNWDLGSYPFWGRYTVVTGYQESANHLLQVHANAAPDTPYELNWDNISTANQAVYTVSPGASLPHRTVWSEDFEGVFPGSHWRLGSNTAGSWGTLNTKAHNYMAYNPLTRPWLAARAILFGAISGAERPPACTRRT